MRSTNLRGRRIEHCTELTFPEPMCLISHIQFQEHYFVSPKFVLNQRIGPCFSAALSAVSTCSICSSILPVSMSTSDMTTLAPELSPILAYSRPIPRAAPVIKIFLLSIKINWLSIASNLILECLLPSAGRHCRSARNTKL